MSSTQRYDNRSRPIYPHFSFQKFSYKCMLFQPCSFWCPDAGLTGMCHPLRATTGSSDGDCATPVASTPRSMRTKPSRHCVAQTARWQWPNQDRERGRTVTTNKGWCCPCVFPHGGVGLRFGDILHDSFSMSWEMSTCNVTESESGGVRVSVSHVPKRRLFFKRWETNIIFNGPMPFFLFYLFSFSSVNVEGTNTSCTNSWFFPLMTSSSTLLIFILF
jgi:hypothetical protein